MSNSERWLRVNQPTIAAEEIEGEVVVVSFDSGHYYSLRDTAADVWRLLDGGVSVGTVMEAFADGVPSVVGAFISALESEGLMVAAQANGKTHTGTIAVGPFSDPKLERFEEMSQMLLYDPIHDVDDTGWPNLPDNAGE